MKKTRKTIAGIAAGAMAFSMLCVFAAVPVFGMTPIDPYGAVPHFSLYPAGGSSPLCIRSLDVTWEIGQAPMDWYREEDFAAFLEFQPRVIAKYVLENPTDQTVLEGMYLPLSQTPEYTTFEVSVSRIAQASKITLGENEITPKIRYAYASEAQNRYDHIVYENDGTMQVLQAETVANLCATPLPADTPVTVYSYVPRKEIKQNSGSQMLDCRVQVMESSPLVFIPGMWSYEAQPGVSGTYVELGGYVDYGEVIYLYAIGEGEPLVDSWKVGRFSAKDEMVCQGKQVTTLGELAMQYYEKDSGISEQDWYYAVNAMLQKQRVEGTCVVSDTAQVGWDVRTLLQPMLYYEIELAPHTTAEHTVEMLAYPGQWPSGSRKFTLGTWCLVPPAPGTFADVGEISLHILTPLYMVEVSYYHTHAKGDYQQDEQGYSMSVSPDVPIVRFTLSSKSNYTTLSMILNEIWGYLSIFGMMLVFAGVPGGTITLIVLLCERRASGKRKGKSTSPTDQATKQETEKGAQS